VLNAGDPGPPTVLEICRAVAGVLGHEWAEVLIGEPAQGAGETFWSVPHPIVLDMTEAELQLRYRPVTTYEKAVPETVEWLVEATKERPWEEVMPRAAEYMRASFDYAAEDAFVAGLLGT
jgi:nucleoside-diphosphate-sugar epimerase